MKDSPHILLVEDDPVDTLAVQRTLRRSGLPHTLVATGDGLEALDWLRDPARLTPQPIVITDLELPQLGGLELVQALRDDPALRNLAVIILTSRDSEDLRDTASRLGVADYLVKPVEPAALLASLRALSPR